MHGLGHGFGFSDVTTRQVIDSITAQMKRDRSPHEPHWQSVGDYMLPYRIRMNLTDQNRGDRRNQKIIDSTASMCLRTLKAGMMNGHTNPADRWFRYRLKDQDLSEFGPVKEWLDQENLATLQDFDRSNLYSGLPLAYGDMSGFATTAMSIEEDVETTIFARVFPIGTYWIATDDKNELCAFYREFRMSIRQIVDRFWKGSMDNFSHETRNLIEQRTRWGDWIDVGQIIMPNREYNPQKLSSNYMKYHQCWFELGVSMRSGPNSNYLANTKDENIMLETGGYNEMPVMLGRWEVGEGDVWGLDSPGMMSIGDTKSLQLGERRSYQAIDKLVDPHYVGPTSLEGKNTDFLPGGITFSDDMEAELRPLYQINPRINEQEEKQEQVRQRIKTAHFFDLFRMLDSLDDRTRTAYEVAERKAEKLNLLAPTTVQVAKGILRPTIDRSFAIRWRQGRVAPPPPELLGQDIEVEYMGVFAQAQRATQVQPIQQLLMQVAPFIEVRPDILDKLDLDQVIDELAHALQVPAKIIRDDKKVAALRAARDRQAALMRAAEVAQQAAGAAKDLAGASMEGDNALTRMSGILQRPGTGAAA